MNITAEKEPMVNGQTRLFGIIGHPIGQVKSPEEVTVRFRALGYNALCLPFHVFPDNFDIAMRGLKSMENFGGIIFTVPHKVRAIGYVDRLSPNAASVGAVNVARRETDGRWFGEMFDGLGLVGAVRRVGFELKGKRAMLIGAGGAGSAIADALAEAGVVSVTIFDIDRDKAKKLTERLGKARGQCQFVFGHASTEQQDILVNATPMGTMPGDGIPADFGRFNANLVVADVVTRPEITPLLAKARAYGCRTATGVQMYEEQADMITNFLLAKESHD